MNRRDTVINGNNYSIILPPVTVCIPLCNRTVALLAPVLSEGLAAATTGDVKNLQAKAAAIIGPALVSLTGALGKVDPNAAYELLKDAGMAAHLSCEGAPISSGTDFEKHFAGNRQDVYPALGWALWECVKDFFPKLEGEAFQTLKGEAAKAWQSPTGGPRVTGSGVLAGRESAHGVNLRVAE